MSISRRSLFLGVSMLALTRCGVVTTNTTNGMTTVTLNVAQVNKWAQAFENGAKLIGGLPGIVGMPAAAVLMGVSALIADDIAAVNVAAGGAVALTFDSTSIPNAVSSLLADAQTLLKNAAAAVPASVNAVIATANTYVAAISELVSVLELSILPAAPTASVASATAQAHALAVLGIE